MKEAGDLLEDGIRKFLGTDDRLVRISREKLFLLLAADSYNAAKSILETVRDHVVSRFGRSITIHCGFSEVRSSDFAESAKYARRLLELAKRKGDNQLSGLYYIKPEDHSHPCRF